MTVELLLLDHPDAAIIPPPRRLRFERCVISLSSGLVSTGTPAGTAPSHTTRRQEEKIEVGSCFLSYLSLI
jgi:hypothetical protein